MPGDDVRQPQLAAHSCARGHVGTGLNLVGDDGIGAAVKAIHTLNLDRIRPRAAHVCAHGVEKVRQIHDMRFARRVFDDGAATRHGGGQNDVHRRADGDLIQIDLCAVQPAVRRVGIDESALDLHIRAHGAHTLDVLVDRPDAEIAAAGHGGLRRAEPAQHGADEIVRRADFPHQIVRRIRKPRLGAINLHRGFIHTFDPRAKPLQNREEHFHVADLRNVFQPADAIDHQHRRDNRNRSVFRAADFDFPVQRPAAANQISIQKCNTSRAANVTNVSGRIVP